MRQGMKNAWRGTCEETLVLEAQTAQGLCKSRHSEEVRSQKEDEGGAEPQHNESQESKSPDQILRNPARQAEEGAGKGDSKELYTITRTYTMAGAKKIPDRPRPVRTKSGEVVTDQEEQRKRWAEHFRKLLNSRPLSEMPYKEPADTFVGQ